MATKAENVKLQSLLTGHGFQVGLIDGIIGDVTKRALKAFQASKGLAQTGKADAATMTALSKAPVKSNEAPDRKAPVTPEQAKVAVSPTKEIWPRQSGVPGFYGAVGTKQTSIQLPYEMKLAWDKSTKLRKMTLHTRCAASAQRVFEKIKATYSAKEIAELGLDIFGGSLNVRKMRGGSAYSMHSWGIAIDFDPERNQLKWGRDKARLARPDAIPFFEAWEDEGWLSLGRARNFDWMHLQAARL